MFLECARCFYLDRRLGVGRPDSPPFTLNNAVDVLLKREFDAYRARREPHPIMQTYGIEAVPFQHPDLERWRDALHYGIDVHDQPTNFLLTGAPDDIWETGDGTLIVVDYKATSTEREITLDDPWKDAYKRQVEFYGWLLKRKGFAVSPVSYFLFANAHRGRDAFDRALHFDLRLLPHEGNDDWVQDAVTAAYECLQDDLPPPSTEGCAWCWYRSDARTAEGG